MMIPTIPTPDEILDKGFSRGKKAADLLRTQKIPKHLKGKKIEERRVVTASIPIWLIPAIFSSLPSSLSFISRACKSPSVQV